MDAICINQINSKHRLLIPVCEHVADITPVAVCETWSRKDQSSIRKPGC